MSKVRQYTINIQQSFPVISILLLLKLYALVALENYNKLIFSYSFENKNACFYFLHVCICNDYN